MIMANDVKKQPMDVESVLKINSPADRLIGPIDVVYRNETEGWAVVSIYWDKYPTLGIRWFWGLMVLQYHTIILNGLFFLTDFIRQF